MAYLEQNIIDELRDRADIVEIINSYMPLKKAGRNFRAVCPFHHEKTASFMVSADKQIYHCFGCGEGGNVFNFVMKYERLNFREALELIAKKTGFVIPESEKKASNESSLTSKLFVINELAASFYQAALFENPKAVIAREYLKSRSVTEKTAKEFRLGFSMPDWTDFIAFAKQKGFSAELVEKAGLAIKGKNQQFYDRFRNKLMFPIFNAQGKIAGFGSRTLEENKNEPKYINSPETEIYTKRKILYGLNLAKNNISKCNQVIITEGYFDVIVPYQEGVLNIVGCLGTSFTQEQAHLLKRYAEEVILLFDADAAGEAAALRGLDILIEEELAVKITCLPAGYDADKFIKEKGIDVFNDFVKKAGSLFDYKLNLLQKKYPPKIVENKAKIADEMLFLIEKIENTVLKSVYIKRLSQEIDISEDALLKRTREIKKTASVYNRNDKIDYKKPEVSPAEKMLLKLMMEDNFIINKVKENLKADDFQQGIVRNVVSVLLLLDASRNKNTGSALIDRIEDENARSFISGLLAEKTMISDNKKAAEDCIKLIKRKKLDIKLTQLETQIKYVEEAKDEEKRIFLSKEYQRILKEKAYLINLR
ncbi:MAG: DNA primase [Candidatus Omnitrophota bacterium]